MKNITRFLFAVPVMALLSSPCVLGVEEATTLPVSTASAGSDRLAGSIHAQVNAYRQSLGKPALQRHPGLDRLARQHAEFMRRNRGKFGKRSAGNLTHLGFEERSLMAQRGMGMSEVGENVGTCSNPGGAAGTLVDAWKRSSGHRMNLKGRWDHTGIGVVVDSDGTVFATQLFGCGNKSHLSLTTRMRPFH